MKRLEDSLELFLELWKELENPDYARCVDISTAAALKEMIVPGIMAVLSPITTVNFTWNRGSWWTSRWSSCNWSFTCYHDGKCRRSLGYLLKYIESGAHGGKGSEAHKAAVVGDTVGDPFKDTSRHSINILIKLMTIVSLVFAPVFVQYGGMLLGLFGK